MTDAAISRRSARPHETRDQILRAASELFAARGFHRTTIRAIADRAELSNTLLYYYFKNKHELLEALLVSREMSTTPPGETWDFREAWQLSEQLLGILYEWVEQPDLIRMLVVESFSGNTTVGEFVDRTNEQYIASIRPALEPLIGEQWRTVAESLQYTLTGVIWDAVIRHGRRYGDVLRTESERERLRTLILLILPDHSSVDAA